MDWGEPRCLIIVEHWKNSCGWMCILVCVCVCMGMGEREREQASSPILDIPFTSFT